MRRFIYVIIINIIFSAPVTENTAKIVAENIIVERFMSTVHGGYTIVSSEMIKDDDQNLIYIFHLNPMGFVLISADDRVSPILAYSYESDFITENMPQNVSYFINTHKYGILDAIENNRIAEQKVIDEWVKYQNEGNLNRRSNNVDPLLTAEFGQEYGWNTYCPEDPTGPGGHAVVGCVAVAMAQIMHYWSFPTSGLASHGYESSYGYLEADFSTAYYDFDAMGDGTEPSDAAALLLSHVGIALEMDYGSFESTAHYYSAFKAFYEHFLFEELNEEWYGYDQIDDLDWIDLLPEDNYWFNFAVNLLKDELDNYRPVLYYGNYPGEDIGHCWNIDGYIDDTFHMNFGWNGYYNGFYRLTDAAIEYTENQGFFRNLIPKDINKSKLFLNSYAFNETNGDMDGVFNPGETIELETELIIPSIFLDADSIAIVLETSDTGISISDYTSHYGVLVAGQELTLDHFEIEIASEITFGSKDFNLYATAFSQGSAFLDTFIIEFDVSLWQSGFPQTIQFKKSTPLVIDYDNDGNKEIIVGDTHGRVRIFNKDGSEILNDDFPYDTGGQIWGSPAAADMDGDGLTDFVISSKSKNVYIFDKTGLKAQYSAGYYLLGTPAIGNLDGDEDLEFVIASYGGGTGNGNGVWAINPDGSVVNGFPIDITPERVKAGVALADFNGNGRDDIVFGTDDGNLCLYYDDGILAEGFPFSTGDKIQSAPGILNMNGQKIIFFGSKDNFFYAVNSDGSLRFSIEANDDIFVSPAFLFYRETYFVFFGDDSGMIYAVDIAGNSLAGWPVSIGDSDYISTSVVFSDLNGDEEPEVIVISDDGKCFVYDIAGNIAEGFPLNNESSFSSAPVVIDIDSDNDLEIMGASINHLSIYDIKTPGSTLNYWNLYQGNNRRTGFESGDECMTEFDCAGVCGGDAIEDCVGECGGSAELDECDICDSDPTNDCIQDCTGEWGGEAVVDECGECGGDGPTDGLDCDGNQLSLFNGLIPEDFSIHSIYPNPFNPITNITYGIPEYVNVQIIIYDLSGKQVYTLINKPKTPGYYSVNWNASAHPSGIYLIKMNSGNYFHTQKVVLIK